jgi:hypothetical protein
MNMNVYELSPRELYDTYAGQRDPAKLLAKDRNEMAARLQMEEGLKDTEDYYAVDQMLIFARKLVEGTLEADI